MLALKSPQIINFRRCCSQKLARYDKLADIFYHSQVISRPRIIAQDWTEAINNLMPAG